MRKEVRTGLTIIIIIAVSLTVFIGYRVYKKKNSTYPLTLILSKTEGLEKDNDIRYLGVKIGYVSRVGTIDKSAFADISINKDVKIPIDSRIEVNRIGLLSEKIISVFPSDKNDYYKPNDTLKNVFVDTIPKFEQFSNAANAVVGVGNMMLQSEIIAKLDTVIALLKEKKNNAE